MHPNPVYHSETDAGNLAFARDRGFGVLAVNSPDGPLMAHIPFVLDESGKWADLHLMRSNPILRLLDKAVPARLAVCGPDGYVSPDWYGMPDQVPTWNYVAVHLTGLLERRPQEELRGVLDLLSAQFETRRAPGAPWTADKMDADTLARMMRMIAPCRLGVGKVDGTWKLAQNKPEQARIGAANGLQAQGIGSEVAALAALMRDL